MTAGPPLPNVSIGVEGLGQAIEAAKDLVVPWRRANAQRLARLEAAQRQAEIHRLNAETLNVQAKTERERSAAEADRAQAELLLAQAEKTRAEAELARAQALKAAAEAEAERAAIRQGQIELALKIVDRYAAELPQTQKLDYVVRLLPTLVTLTASPLEPLDLEAAPPAAGL